MKAIILDGQLKSSLTIVRSLGRAGVACIVGAERETGMALHSTYTQECFVYPSPYTHQNEFIERIKDIAVRAGDKPVVYACSDATYLSLYQYKDELSAYITLTFPDEKSVEIAFDKAATYSLARVSGVPTITTYALEMHEEVARLGDTLTYPVVIKPRRSVTWRNGIGVFGTAHFMHTKETLLATFVRMKKELGEAPLIQDLLLGEEYGVEMLARDGVVYARVTHHRMRSLSPTGGASVLKETVLSGDLKDTLEAYAQILVSKLKWSGPIMVEFKVDSDTRAPKLMEINGRFWGSLPLSVHAGVDMPYLYFRHAAYGETPSHVCEAQEGVVSEHFLGDVKYILKVLFVRDKMRKILYPRRLQALHDFCMLPRGVRYDVWSIHDPKPSLYEIIDTIQKICKRKK